MLNDLVKMAQPTKSLGAMRPFKLVYWYPTQKFIYGLFPKKIAWRCAPIQTLILVSIFNYAHTNQPYILKSVPIKISHYQCLFFVYINWRILEYIKTSNNRIFFVNIAIAILSIIQVFIKTFSFVNMGGFILKNIYIGNISPVTPPNCIWIHPQFIFRTY